MSKLNAKSKSKAVKSRASSSKSKKTFYVTTPIYYVNDVPHIGHAYTTIAADVLARFHRLKGKKVFFLTGTDEHGEKVQTAAAKQNLNPKEFCDRLVPAFKKAWEALNISNDFFIRTSDSDHEARVKKLIELVNKKGDIYKGEYEGLYCVPCESFWTELQLKEGKCPQCSREVKNLKEESYFFRLSKYQKKLLEFYEKNPEFLQPKSRGLEIINRVREGLKDLSITRASFRWGVEFPLDKKHVVYVWFDALPNYITALGWPEGKNFKEFWPADVHLIGKEINWFHSVIWPAMLFSAGLEPPKTVFAHGWWTVDGQKMSKSVGNVIDPIKTAEKYGVDALRFYLFREVSFGQDGDFSESRLKEKINSDLADGLGNLLNRSLVLCEKSFDGKVPEKIIDKNISAAAEKLVLEYDKDLESFEFHAALDKIWAFIFSLNKYINDTKPWEVSEKKKLSEVIYTLLESLRIISVLTYPFTPQTSEKIFSQLGLKKSEINFSTIEKFGFLKSGNKIARGEILFKKIETKEVKSMPSNMEKGKIEKQKQSAAAPQKAAPAQTPSTVSYSEFAKLDLRVAEILSAEPVEGSDKLVKLQISIGAEKKQIVAGIKSSYSPAELVGKQIIIVNNLEPREFKAVGLTSYGMLLAADSETGPILLTTDKNARAGAKIS